MLQLNRHPTWDDNIRRLFTAPYWVAPARRQDVAQGWRQCMDGYGIALDQYESVCAASVTIYEHLQSRAMPLSDDPSQYWPAAALKQLRIWINEGMRKSESEPIHRRSSQIPPPRWQPQLIRVRRNILDLSEDELNDYCMRVERLGTDRSDPASPWQQIAYIHTNWCLHYQEAFLLWHRAYLLYIEERLGCAIPYWNFMSPNAARDGDPAAGLVAPFKRNTYIHPRTKRARPNPLRYALAKDGKSKACELAQAPNGEKWRALCVNAGGECQCKYVQRDPVLYSEGDDQREQRLAKLALLQKFQQQVVYALQWPTFSSPEGAPGYPWANIQSFDPPPPDSDYPHRCDFDGLYEQPHDNFHGWFGADMADNAYTAFDPVFLSYHANIDRIFEEWKRAHPTATFSAGFPIRPFVGPDAKHVDFTTPHEYVYTTIGDMARDSRALGYDFEAPKLPDVGAAATAAGTISAVTATAQGFLYVLFTGVRCTYDSYTIDVFLNLPNPQPSDVTGKPTHYAGRMTRLGMGVEDDKGRCIVKGVTRVLDASATARELHLTPGSAVTLDLLVTDLTRNQVLTPEEYAHLPGFAPHLRWGTSLAAVRPPTPADHDDHACCHHQDEGNHTTQSTHNPQTKETKETSMAPLASFSSPAGQADKDFGSDAAGLKAFLSTWSTNLNSWTEIAIVGNPWSSRNDYNRSCYFNPLQTDIPDDAKVAPIMWNAFPGRLFNFFLDPTAPPSYQLTVPQIYALADSGMWPTQFLALGDVPVPTNPELCPTTNWWGDKQGYTPQGPRGWLDEYCEWSIKRDADGQLRQVMFTCENPAYWFNLWRHDPDLVTSLYQKHINPNVQKEDLYLLDANGNPVIDPLLGGYAYDPTNKWNSGTQTQSDRGGAMHLTSPPNTLAAEIYLAAAGTIPRSVGNQDAQALICCTWYGRPRRNSDPTIGLDANQAANGSLQPGETPSACNLISLTDPVGLYIQRPTTNNWTVPNKKQPDNSNYDPASFWQITRGHLDPKNRDPNTVTGTDSILHAVFTVPEGLFASDILISDPNNPDPNTKTMPLQYAGQIARTFQIALRVTLFTPTTPVVQAVRDCVPFVVPSSDPALQPWPVQFLSSAAFQANSVDDSPLYAKQGTVTEVALVVQGGTQAATIEFVPPDGIEPVTIKQFIGGNPNAPGQTSGGSTQVYIFDLVVANNAPVGERQIRVINRDRQLLPEQDVAEPGWLIVAPA